MEEKKENSLNLQEMLGSPWLTIVQLLLLMGKYQTQCVFLPIDINVCMINQIHTTHDIYSLVWDSQTNILSFPDLVFNMKDFKNTLKNCDTERFYVIPIVLERYDKETLKKSLHINVLIYDKLTYSLERYEPNGMGTNKKYKPSVLDKKLKKLFEELFQEKEEEKRKIVYYKPISFCPLQGPQVREYLSRTDKSNSIDTGTCSLWSMIYVDKRLSNPTKSRDEIDDIIKNDIKNKNQSFYNFIMNYLKQLNIVSKLLKECKSEKEIMDVLLKNILNL
jgi:hypothetical protein